MGLNDRLKLYGAIWGGGAFLMGLVITYFVAPQNPDVPHWRFASWLYLNANYVQVNGIQVASIRGAFENYDLLPNYSLTYLRGVPVATLAVGSILVSNSMGWTDRIDYILKNSAYAASGYFVMGLLTIIGSDARPTVSIILAVFVIAALALLVGSAFVDKFTGALPVIAIVSLGGVFLIGLVLIAGSVVVLQAVFPLAAVSLVSSSIGGGLLWIARNMSL